MIMAKTAGTLGKKIEGFPDYTITNDGRVWSIKKKKWLKTFENIIKNRTNDQPYLRIALYKKEGIRKKIMVHRLVGLAYLDNPESKPFINHINGNKHDNRFKNLEWVTTKENSHHASRNNLNFKKLSDEQVRDIRTKFHGWSHQKIADYYGVSRKCISMIISRKRRVLVK